jgi:hypothetical protein
LARLLHGEKVPEGEIFDEKAGCFLIGFFSSNRLNHGHGSITLGKELISAGIGYCGQRQEEKISLVHTRILNF